MTRIMKFIKTAAVGGLLVIVPIAIVLSVLAQIFYALYSLSQNLLGELGIEVDDASHYDRHRGSVTYRLMFFDRFDRANKAR
jgi:uncharacterized membrane protein